MKKSILFILVFLPNLAIAQRVEIGLSAGSGKTYIVEDWEKSLDINYGLPTSLAAELKFTPENSAWGVKLRLNSIQTSIYGNDWSSTGHGFIDGYVNSINTFILMEYEILNEKSAYGFNYGLGFSKENLEIRQNTPWDIVTQKYPTFIVGGHLTFRFSKSINFQIIPSLLVQDPFRAIGSLIGDQEPRLECEDISFLINFGIRYNLIKPPTQP